MMHKNKQKANQVFGKCRNMAHAYATQSVPTEYTAKTALTSKAGGSLGCFGC